MVCPVKELGFRARFSPKTEHFGLATPAGGALVTGQSNLKCLSLPLEEACRHRPGALHNEPCAGEVFETARPILPENLAKAGRCS